MKWVKWMLGVVTEKKSYEIIETTGSEQSQVQENTVILEKLVFAAQMGLEEININKLINYLKNYESN